jgi:hypothetical protein
LSLLRLLKARKIESGMLWSSAIPPQVSLALTMYSIGGTVVRVGGTGTDVGATTAFVAVVCASVVGVAVTWGGSAAAWVPSIVTLVLDTVGTSRLELRRSSTAAIASAAMTATTPMTPHGNCARLNPGGFAERAALTSIPLSVRAGLGSGAGNSCPQIGHVVASAAIRDAHDGQR